jgi:hypothetical protein
MAMARTLYAEGKGWTPTEIVRLFAKEGLVVHVNTVREWVTPNQAEQRRQWQRQAHAASKTDVVDPQPCAQPRSDWTPEKEARLLQRGLALRATTPPVPYTAISVVFARYENAKIGPDALRGWLTANGAARDERKARDLAALKAAGKIKPQGQVSDLDLTAEPSISKSTEPPHGFFDAARRAA